jgi:peptide/nickel transport system substrate-binding protein
MREHSTGGLSRRQWLKSAGGAIAASAVGFPHRSGARSAGPELEHLTLGLAVETTTLDPHMHVSRWNLDTINQIYEQLVHRDPKARMIPGLATAWRSVGERTWRFELRKGVKFHNGEPLDAESVKYAYDRIMDPNQKSPMASNLRLVEKVTIVDSHAVDLVTKAPAPVLPAYLSLYSNIVNRAWLRAKGDEFAARNANGTGPFKFVEWRKGEHLKLARNDEYWGGPAAIKTVTLRPIPDANTRVLALRKGEADIIQDLPPALADEIRRDPELRVSAVPSIRVHFFVIRADVKPLDDPRVRQALNYAVDKEALTKQLLRGYGHPLTQILTPAILGYNPEVKGYPYDPEKAKALLREAGYPKGFSTEISGWPGVQDIVQAVAGYLKAVGVDAAIRIDEFKVNYENLMKRKATPINYLTWGNWNLFDADGTVPFLMLPDSQWSYYTPPARFADLNKVASTTMDQKKRLDAYREMMTIAQAEAPLLLLHQQFDINAANKKSTWETRYDNVMLLYGAHKA